MPLDRSKRRAESKKAAVTKRADPAPGADQAAPLTDGGTTSLPEAQQVQLLFPPSLTAKQRALLHEAAALAGVEHASHGEGATRSITLGPAAGQQVRVQDGRDGVPDDQLLRLLRQHLNLDAAAVFAASSRGGGGGAGAPSGSGGAEASGGRCARRLALQGSQPSSLEAFVALHSELLELERVAEVAAAAEAAALCRPEAAQARGRALLNLRVADAEGGLLGRTLLTLVANKGYVAGAPPLPLPPHKFSPHDVVELRPHKGGGGGGAALCGGLVYRVKEGSIVVAVDEAPDEGLDQPLRLEKLANEVTYQRMRETLQRLVSPPPTAGVVTTGGGSTSGTPLPGLRLVDIAFGRTAPRFAPALPPWQPVNKHLDASQRRAVGLALSAQDLALVHGPPGTGKTTAVVEYIVQELRRGSRVLAAAASNIAVDNLTERLVAAAPQARIVRMGHPARLLPQVLAVSLEAHVLRSDNSALAADCRAEVKELSRQLLRLEPWRRAERRQLRGELRRLAKEERQRQGRALAEVVDGAQVVCCTLSGALHHQLAGQVFDVAVIDEAAQALEAAAWGAMLKAGRAVLAGDHLQLPPTVTSDEAARRGLSVTLFERLLAGTHGPALGTMLTVQYRMNQSIMEWSSKEMYQGLLEAHASVAHHTLAGLPRRLPAADGGGGTKAPRQAAGRLSAKAAAPGAKASAAAAAAAASSAGAGVGALAAALPVLLLVDTAGCGFEEQREADGGSRCNPGEAAAAMAHVAALLAAGLDADDIGVITPYSAQVGLLRELRPPELAGRLEISTVDGFQGREKEAVVISCVRSSASGGVGFLADARRMNVAVTRARRHAALVGDSETLSRDPFLARLVDYLSEHGDYVSAAELVPSA